MMDTSLSDILCSLQKSGTFINTLIAGLTICGQQLFSSFTFSCPCQPGNNLYYGSAFLIIPALVLLIVGYALRSQTWMITKESCCCSSSPHLRSVYSLQRKLACLTFFSITGRALVAPLTWLAVTLLTGTHYECAASEYVSVDQYSVFDNFSVPERQEMLAEFPCFEQIPADMLAVRNEVALQLRYQSQMLGWTLIAVATLVAFLSCCLARCCSPLNSQQHYYWSCHVRNERELFEQAAEQHSRILITQRIKELFGFTPGCEDVRQIRIPSCQDWKDISRPSLVCITDNEQGHYNFLGERLDVNCEEGKSEAIELTS
ncbi:calcium homeostasis modulator protein 4 [Dromiciops gliroides]|uniref:calcium homeostasis modulator protein 4 n=1 Tax=Dromiciops gliroides TaxID=33562 RepID=UPI001CC5755B|nr:calcium homeostasis modulator protein 4 [Dromiciops gliroides]